MSYFDIDGYQPQWLNGSREILAAHGPRLHALAGRRLRRAWLVWDLDDDEWFADCPVLLDFDDEQVEINHQKFDDLSVTWNTVSPAVQTTWSNGESDGYVFHLGWRHDAHPELAALQGQELQAVNLVEWAGSDMANGMVAVNFVFPDGQVTVHNALDENGLEFGPPHHNFRMVSRSEHPRPIAPSPRDPVG
jgi:hypothetical protein